MKPNKPNKMLPSNATLITVAIVVSVVNTLKMMFSDGMTLKNAFAVSCLTLVALSVLYFAIVIIAFIISAIFNQD